MSITFTQITSNLASVTFAYGDQPITIVYYPAKITEKTFAGLSSFSSISEDTFMERFGALNDLLYSLIKSWDVYEDDMQTTMFPLQTDRLAELPIMFRTQVLAAIMENMNPNWVAPTTN